MKYTLTALACTAVVMAAVASATQAAPIAVGSTPGITEEIAKKVPPPGTGGDGSLGNTQWCVCSITGFWVLPPPNDDVPCPSNANMSCDPLNPANP